MSKGKLIVIVLIMIIVVLGAGVYILSTKNKSQQNVKSVPPVNQEQMREALKLRRDAIKKPTP